MNARLSGDLGHDHHLLRRAYTFLLLNDGIARQIRVPSRFVWVDGRLAIRAVSRCCGRDVRRVCRVDLKYRSVRRAGPLGRQWLQPHDVL